ncbi:MAG: hypothetical protein J6C79_01125 [Clostridia bacterium]|nr:hypothetical protein [Clostridia bacterium]
MFYYPFHVCACTPRWFEYVIDCALTVSHRWHICRFCVCHYERRASEVR